MRFFTFLFMTFFVLSIQAKNHSLKINIVSRDLFNEAGKEVDAKILKEELEHLGHQVFLFDYLKTPHIPKAHINIFLAQFRTNLFSSAKLNWFIPNPDFCLAKREDIGKFDLVLCKTEESLHIFKPFSKECYFLGFMSLDCHQVSFPKNFSKCLHVAGKSKMKGTEEVLKAWRDHSDLPSLILIRREAHYLNLPENIRLITKRVSEKNLTKMQNECGIHLCTSKTEGFGHYIMEAMSAAAVVVTTDAPPMNEFIKDQRCLVKYKEISHQYYATTFIIDEDDLTNVVRSLGELSDEELKEIGQANRNNYLRRVAEFKKNFADLMEKVGL